MYVNTMPSDSRTPERRRQQDRRAQAESAMLDAAAQLFARRGVDQTTTAEIGEGAGYSRGLPTQHFGSKADLVERLARRSQSDFVAQLPDFDGDEVAALIALCRSYLTGIDHSSETTRAFYVMWGAALPLEAPLRPIFVGHDGQFRMGIEALIRSGQRHGTVSADVDPGGAATALVGMLRGISAQYLISSDDIDLSAAENACIFFVQALTAASTSTHAGLQ